MATTNILSFTDVDGNSQKIASVSIFKITDGVSVRVIDVKQPTKSFKSSQSLSALISESGNLFTATETKSGFTIGLNSIYVSRIGESPSSGCEIIFQGGEKITVDESVSVIEARIDAIGGQVAVVDPTPPTTLSNASYYNLTNVGNYTIVDAADVYDVNNAFQMTMYNNSGSVCTFNRDGSTVFNFLGEQLTTFDLLDGEEITLTAVSTTQYNIG